MHDAQQIDVIQEVPQSIDLRQFIEHDCIRCTKQLTTNERRGHGYDGDVDADNTIYKIEWRQPERRFDQQRERERETKVRTKEKKEINDKQMVGQEEEREKHSKEVVVGPYSMDDRKEKMNVACSER